MAPILASVHLWMYHGDYGGVLKHSIIKKSIFETKRDRSFWSKLYQIRPDGVINPLLIHYIDTILLVGRSINLLKVISPCHAVLTQEPPIEMELLDYSREAVSGWESSLDRWTGQMGSILDQIELDYLEKQRAKFVEQANIRRAYNTARDNAEAERIATHAREKAEKAEKYRADLAEQVAAWEREQERVAADELKLEAKIKMENEKREKLIEEEKERLIAQFEGTDQTPDHSKEEEIERELKSLRSQLQVQDQDRKQNLVNERTLGGMPSLGNCPITSNTI